MKAKGASDMLSKKQARYGYLFILPLIVGVLLFFLPNMVKTIVFSINTISVAEGGFSLDFVGLEHYSRAFDNINFVKLLPDALLDIFTSIPTIVIFSLVFAVILNQKFKGRLIARIIFFIPVLLSTGVIAKTESSTSLMYIVENVRDITTGTAMDGFNAVDFQQFLTSLHLPAGLISIVDGAASGIYEMVQHSGIQIYILLAALQEIPQSLYEAARVEGCNGWEVFWKITFPMVSPQLIVISVYTIVDTFTSQNNPIFQYLYSVAFSQNQYSYSTAMSLIFLACVAAIILVIGGILTKLVKKFS